MHLEDSLIEVINPGGWFMQILQLFQGFFEVLLDLLVVDPSLLQLSDGENEVIAEVAEGAELPFAHVLDPRCHYFGFVDGEVELQLLEAALWLLSDVLQNLQVSLIEEEDRFSHPLPGSSHLFRVAGGKTGLEGYLSSVLVFGIGHDVEDKLNEFHSQGLIDETFSGKPDHFLEGFDIKDRSE